MDLFQKPQKLAQTPFFGLDYGKKVVGIAYFQPKEDIRSISYGRILYQSDEQVLSELKKLVFKENIENIVLGLPLYPDGNPSKMSERVLVFASLLRKTLPEINLYSQDESGSTLEAQELMKNSERYQFTVDLKKLDEVSATIILDRFINNF